MNEECKVPVDLVTEPKQIRLNVCPATESYQEDREAESLDQSAGFYPCVNCKYVGIWNTKKEHNII